MQRSSQDVPAPLEDAAPAEPLRADPLGLAAIGCVLGGPAVLAVLLFLKPPDAFVVIPLVLVPLGVLLGLAAFVGKRAHRYRAGWMKGAAVLLGIILIASVFVPPSPGRSRATANRVKCGSNLKQIGLAVQLYAKENGGRFPPDLAALVLTQELEAAALVCPASQDEAAQGPHPAAIAAALPTGPYVSYQYVGQGLTSASPGTAVLAYEALYHHGAAGMNVLRADGSVTFLPRAYADALIASLAAPATRPATSPATTSAAAPE
jgi:hypothetical protein